MSAEQLVIEQLAEAIAEAKGKAHVPAFRDSVRMRLERDSLQGMAAIYTEAAQYGVPVPVELEMAAQQDRRPVECAVCGVCVAWDRARGDIRLDEHGWKYTSTCARACDPVECDEAIYRAHEVLKRQEVAAQLAGLRKVKA